MSEDATPETPFAHAYRETIELVHRAAARLSELPGVTGADAPCRDLVWTEALRTAFQVWQVVADVLPVGPPRHHRQPQMTVNRKPKAADPAAHAFAVMFEDMVAQLNGDREAATLMVRGMHDALHTQGECLRSEAKPPPPA
jgi:hypothetical protein